MWQSQGELDKDIRYVFDTFDKDKCQSLSLWQFHFAHVAALGVAPAAAEIEQLFGSEAVKDARWCTSLVRAEDCAAVICGAFDAKRVSFDEFHAAVSKPKCSTGSIAWDLFDEMDVDAKGFMSCDDWQHAVHELLPDMGYDRIREHFARLDSKKFGRILFRDFEALLMASSSPRPPA